MAEASIPVDLFNPGQVFACMGFLEAAEALLGEAEGGFDWDSADCRFLLRAPGNQNPFAVSIDLLQAGHTVWLSPDPEVRERDGGETAVWLGQCQSPDPKPADLPAEISKDGAKLPFGFWADGSGLFNTPFKKSNNGSSCHIRWQNAVGAITALGTPEGLAGDPLNSAWATESLFRLDPRGYTNPIDAGLSPDKLRKGGIMVRVATYPICEAMAVVGLTWARPFVVAPGRLLRYFAWAGLLPSVLARAAMGSPAGVCKRRAFVLHHAQVEGGRDREIVGVHEETEDD